MSHFDDIIGLIGVSLVLLAYALLQVQRINPMGFWYSFNNAAGSALIIISLLVRWNLSAFVMEFTWFLVSLYGVVMYFFRRNSKAYEILEKRKHKATEETAQAIAEDPDSL